MVRCQRGNGKTSDGKLKCVRCECYSSGECRKAARISLKRTGGRAGARLVLNTEITRRNCKWVGGGSGARVVGTGREQGLER